jgi:predicted chitinase
MLPILARAAGGVMARRMMGRKTKVRVGQAQSQSSNAIVKSEKFTGRSTKASTALVRPPAPMKQVSGGTVSKDDPIKVIHVKTLQIESILAGTLASEKAELKRKKSDFRNQSRQDQEDKLEKKDLKPDKKMKMPKVPGTGGIFGWIRKFIGNILMGIFLIKMIDHVDKLKGIVMVLGRVTDFMSEVGIKLVDGFATFVDWGYKAYDATQGFLKNFGVQPELFDQFSGALSGLIDALIIGSVILAARGEDGFGPGGLEKARRPKGRRPGVTTGRGGQQPRFRIPGTRPRVTQGGGRRLPGAPVTQGRGGQGTRPRLPGTRPRVTGGGAKPQLPKGTKGGAKGGLFGLIMMIPTLFEAGGLISQGYWKTAANVLLSAGAAMAAYAGTVAAIGAAALALTGVSAGFGSPAAIALLIGAHASAMGASIGTYTLTSKALKALGLRDDDPALKAQGYQEGGRVKKPKKKPVTRTIGGKKKKAKVKNIIRRPSKERLLETPPRVDPSAKNAQTKSRAWWDFLGWAGTGNQVIDKQTQELTDKVTDVGNTLGRDDYFGPLLRSTSKIILDQEITSSDVRNVGLGINYLIAQGLQKGRIERALKAYSEGGDVSSLIGGLDVTSWVEDTFRKTAKASIRTPNLNMSTGTNTGTPGTGTTPSPGSSTSSSGTPFSGNMKGAQIGEQHLLDAMKKYNYTGDPAALMAIVKGESSFQAKEEDMYVSAERAYEIFGPKGGNRITSVQHAQELIDAGKEAFFNHVYQPKYVPMNEQPGDGYRYIGRGHIQLTGRSNYRDIGEIIGRNLEEDPLQILNNPTVSAEAAVGFMLRAQKYGQDVNSIEGALKAVGGSQTSWPDKRKYYQEYQKKIQSGQLGKNTPATPNVQPGSSQPASINIPPSISSGTGGNYVRSAKGTKLAGDLGRYIYKTLTPQAKAADGVGDFSYASEHPDFGGSFKRSYKSWHNVDRAIDIGGYWPQDQTKILAKVLEFNEKHGVTPVELLYGKPGTPLASTHGDHVHVAYEKGGMTLGKPHLALIGEKGKEIVIDNDSSVAEVTPMLLAINAAKNKQGVLDAIRDYAPYDERSNKVVIVDDSDSMNMQDTGDRGGSTMILPLGGTSYDNSFDFLDYQG